MLNVWRIFVLPAVSLWFSINREKSVLQPDQRIIFLGFVLDFLNMTNCLSDTCKGVILDICKKSQLW